MWSLYLFIGAENCTRVKKGHVAWKREVKLQTHFTETLSSPCGKSPLTLRVIVYLLVEDTTADRSSALALSDTEEEKLHKGSFQGLGGSLRFLARLLQLCGFSYRAVQVAASSFIYTTGTNTQSHACGVKATTKGELRWSSDMCSSHSSGGWYLCFTEVDWKLLSKWRWKLLSSSWHHPLIFHISD